MTCDPSSPVYAASRIGDAVRDALKGSEVVAVDALAKTIQQIATDHLQRLSDEGKIVSHRVNYCKTLWLAMSTLEKAKWFFCNRVLPWIGREVRAQHSNAAALAAYLQDNHPIEAAQSIADLPRKLPDWAHPDPFATLIVDFFFTPIRPVQTITFTASVSNDSLG